MHKLEVKGSISLMLVKKIDYRLHGNTSKVNQFTKWLYYRCHHQNIKWASNWLFPDCKNCLQHFWFQIRQKIICFYLFNFKKGRQLRNRHCTIDNFFVMDFFSNCEQIRGFLRIWPHLLKKSFMENFMFCALRAHARF